MPNASAARGHAAWLLAILLAGGAFAAMLGAHGLIAAACALLAWLVLPDGDSA